MKQTWYKNYFFLESRNLKIIGGQDAQKGQFPYQVSLQLCVFEICEHRCGGILVNSNFVLTAAGCIYSSDVAVIGAFNLSDTTNTTTVKVVEYIVHPDYDRLVSFGNIYIYRVFMKKHCFYIKIIMLTARQRSSDLLFRWYKCSAVLNLWDQTVVKDNYNLFIKFWKMLVYSYYK